MLEDRICQFESILYGSRGDLQDLGHGLSRQALYNVRCGVRLRPMCTWNRVGRDEANQNIKTILILARFGSKFLFLSVDHNISYNSFVKLINTEQQTAG